MQARNAVLIPILLVLPTLAHSGQVDVERMKGKTIFASFESIDPTGCIITDAFFFGSNATTQTAPGAPNPSPLVTLTLSRVNICTGVILVEATGSGRVPEIQVDPTLGSAGFSGTITVDDLVSSSFVDVAVNLRWAATGPLVHQASDNQVHSRELIINEHFSGSMRPAVANGTIFDGHENWSALGSIDAQLQDLDAGQITVQHP